MRDYEGRPKGHIRATRAPVGASPLHVTVGSASTLPDDYQMPSVCMEQGQTSSCTGHGYFKGPAETWARARGLAFEPVSALAGYTGGRSLMLPLEDNLSDSGADPAAVVDFATRYGLLPEKVRPFTEDTAIVNARLSFYELEVAAECRVDSFTVLSGWGDDLSLAVRTAIAQNRPVPFAMSVDASYERWQGDVAYEGPTGSSLGNHAQYLAGYRRRADVGFDFLIVGSWGPLLGIDGKVWARDTFIVGNQCFDRYAMNFAHVPA